MFRSTASLSIRLASDAVAADPAQRIALRLAGAGAALALLVAILGWRLLRGKRVLRASSTSTAQVRSYPGTDSEFYALTKSLPARAAGETLTAWIARVAPGAHAEALRLHLRYRFDPQGLSGEERRRLRELCRASPAPAG